MPGGDPDAGGPQRRSADGDPAGPAGEPAHAGGPGAAPGASSGGGSSLIDPERGRSYQQRWNVLKGEFVDEPRRAVHDANQLVGEVLDEMEEVFRRQRDDLEQQFARQDASTEDLRQALGRYREFFDRLLSL